MIFLAVLLAIAAPTNPHPATIVPDQHFGRWTLAEVQDEYPPRAPVPFGPWVFGHQTLSMQSADGRIGWEIEASNMGFGVEIRMPSTGKMRFGVSAGPADFPRNGAESRFFDELVGDFVLIDKQSLSPMERLRYQRDIQSTEVDFIAAIKVMRNDAQALYGGVHRAPPCNPPSCVY